MGIVTVWKGSPLLDRFRMFLHKSLPDFHRFPSNSVESGEAEVRRDLSWQRDTDLGSRQRPLYDLVESRCLILLASDSLVANRIPR